MSDEARAATEAWPAERLHRVEAQAITRRHDALLQEPGGPEAWPMAPQGTVAHWIDVNHRCNALLWAQEDLARRTHVPDAEIVANKRAIDRHNQQRNDAVEKLDELLLAALGWWRPAGPQGMDAQVVLPAGARLHSETAGAMVDRLSILALKIQAVQLLLNNAPPLDDAHTALTQKLQRLQAQRIDLSACLEALWADALAGRAGFKIYRQFKLYNDPRTNPALLAERPTQAP